MVKKLAKTRLRFWLMAISLIILCVYLGFELGKAWGGYRFVRVVDGDTIVVANIRDGEESRMRLVGIDAPEAKECFFAESGAILKENLSGRSIEYKTYGRDGFGRLLGIVYANGIDVSQIMVSSGAATAYDAQDVHDKNKPELGYFTYLQKIEETPRQNKVGIWSAVCLR